MTYENDYFLFHNEREVFKKIVDIIDNAHGKNIYGENEALLEICANVMLNYDKSLLGDRSVFHNVKEVFDYFNKWYMNHHGQVFYIYYPLAREQILEYIKDGKHEELKSYINENKKAPIAVAPEKNSPTSALIYIVNPFFSDSYYWGTTGSPYNHPIEWIPVNFLNKIIEIDEALEKLSEGEIKCLL